MKSKTKVLMAIAMVLVMAVSAFLVLPVEDSDGAASKGQHEEITQELVSSDAVTLTTTSGEKIIDIKIEFKTRDDGKLDYTIYMKGASEYNDKQIQMKRYNGDGTFFYIAKNVDNYILDAWIPFYTLTASSAGEFKADFYAYDRTQDSGTVYGKSGTASLHVKFNATPIYDYTTELKYDLNEGSGGPTSSTEREDHSKTVMSYVAMTVSDASDMKRDGFVFKGWSKSLSDTTNLIQPGASISVPAGEATTLYAIWAEDTVTVTLMDGDTVYEKRVVRRGAVPTLPSNLTKADSTFVGWFTDEGLTEKWDSSSKATKDMTLYAGWKPDFYFITDPVADCKVTKVSSTTYLFDATVSKDYESSAKITSWTVLKDGEAIYESTGPYMTYQFMEYGKYEVQVKLVNDYGVESVHTETITIEEPSSIDLKSIAIFLIVAVLVVALVVRYLI